MSASAPRDRHYGLDWLRIGAFALLIGYHVGMVFAPWHWVVKWPETVPALIPPMALLTPWRIPLLFVVSGFATRKLIARTSDLRGFAHGRSLRLMVPVAFALLVLLPPEMWVRVRLAGDPDSFPTFWMGDYWSPIVHYGAAFPNWEHLWFVVYLWAYTMVLAALVGAAGAARIQGWFERIADGRGLAIWPVAGLAGAKLALLFVVPETHGLTTDWAGHAAYFPLFLFGFALGGSPLLWAGIARSWRPALALAVPCAAITVWSELTWQGDAVPGHAVMAIDRASRLAMAWGVVVALLRLADVHLNRDHPLRAPLGEAVFPAYLIHQPVIVVLAWWAPVLGLSPAASFVFLFGATALSCAAFYLIGREIGWLRPLIGLAPAPAIKSLAA